MEVNGKELQTPKFLPVVNFMTGNPEPHGKKGLGIFQNGGLWKYIKMEMIGERCDEAVLTQILHFTDFSLNKTSFDLWLSKKIDNYFKVLYKGKNGRVAHECIFDIRGYDGITAEDVAKRLMDYGFHAPTLSWPVSGTVMVEPTV